MKIRDFKKGLFKGKKVVREGDKGKGILYYLIAVYIGYMGISILRNRINGDDTMSYPLAVFFSLIFILGAVWVFWYGFELRKKANISQVSEDNKESIESGRNTVTIETSAEKNTNKDQD